MAEEKISRGIPPKSVTAQNNALDLLMSGRPAALIQLPNGPQEEEPPEQDTEAEQVLPEQHFEGATEGVSLPSAPTVRKTYRGILESELLDIEFNYVEAAENAFSVMFFMPLDAGLNARPKKTLNFVLNCEGVSRQQVTYVGEPSRFPTLGFSLLVLLKAED